MIKSGKKTVKAKKLRKDIDHILKEQVHERDGQICLRCKKPRGAVVIQAAHVYGKGTYTRLRYEPDNILCYACHIHWAHKQPLEFTDWFRANWPDRNDKLHSLKTSAERVNLKELLAELRS